MALLSAPQVKHSFRDSALIFSTLVLFLLSDVQSVSLKSSSCYPGCTPGRGLCIEGRCFCRSPFGGRTCDDVVYKPKATASTDNPSQPANGGPTDAERDDDDAFAGSGLDLFGAGDEAGDAPVGQSKDAAGASPVVAKHGAALKIDSGELRLHESSFQQFDTDEGVSSSSGTQRLEVNDRRVVPLESKAPSVPPVANAPFVAESSIANDMQSQGSETQRQEVNDGSSVPLESAAPSTPFGLEASFGAVSSTGHDRQGSVSAMSGLVGGLPPADVRDEGAGSLWRGGHQMLRHQRHHSEKSREPLLFASSEPMLKLAEFGVRSTRADPFECVPWLAEFRSWDLFDFTQGKGSISDMKHARSQSFKTRVGGASGLTNTKFFKSLPNWYNGPTHAEAATLFNRLDTSGDGQLSFEEYNWENVCGFRGVLLSVLGAQQKLFSQGFSLMDKDANGELEKSEFISQSTGKLLGLSTTVAETVFNLLDIDSGSSGKITRTEFELLGGLPRMRLQVEEKEPDDEAAFKQADTNGDGILDNSEFVTHAKDMGDFKVQSAVTPILNEIDVNNDGSVNKTEYVDTCIRNTGGMCTAIATDCDEWRGPVFCGSSANVLQKPCLCAPGYCAKNGACIPEELRSSIVYTLGPNAGKVLKQMQHVDAEHLFKKYLGGKSDMNAAESVAAVLLGIAIMMQLKGAFTAFPILGVLTFIASVVAFTVVTMTCFRAYTSPNSIENNVQLLLTLLLFCAITMSMTALVRVWGPSDNKMPLICFFVTDDEDEYGLNIGEETKVRLFSHSVQSLMFICIIALWEAPLDGVKNAQTRFMLIMLYVFIVILDTQLLTAEADSCAARRQKCDLHLCQIVRQGSDDAERNSVFVKVGSLAAWWNDFVTDDTLVNKLPYRNSMDYVHRNKINALQDSGSLLKRACSFTRLRALHGVQPQVQEPEVRNELWFLAAAGAHVHYVMDQVVVIWDDAVLELVVRDEVDDQNPWVTLEEAAKKKIEAAQQHPAVRVAKPGSASGSQTLQEKMLLVAQAGASGLIIGQRWAGPLSADPFKEEAKPISNEDRCVWPGLYTTVEIDGYIAQPKGDAESFSWDWSGQTSEQWIDFLLDRDRLSKVQKGCAVNTFLITCSDMQELEWLLEDRGQDTTYDSDKPKKGSTEMAGRKYAVCAAYGQRRRQNGEVASPNFSPITRFNNVDSAGDEAQVIAQDMQACFSKVFAYQRQILSNVSHSPEGPMAFLGGVRSWIEDTWWVKMRKWKYVHILLTAGILIVVYEMSRTMYKRLHDNDAELWAYLFVLLVTILNGNNTSVRINWLRFKCVSWNESLGTSLTMFVFVSYVVGIFAIFVYYAVVKHMLNL